MRIYKDFIQVGVGSFYPISRIREIRYWNHSPIITEMLFQEYKNKGGQNAKQLDRTNRQCDRSRKRKN